MDMISVKDRDGFDLQSDRLIGIIVLVFSSHHYGKLHVDVVLQSTQQHHSSETKL